MQIPFLHRKSPAKRTLIAAGSIAVGMAGVQDHDPGGNGKSREIVATGGKSER